MIDPKSILKWVPQEIQEFVTKESKGLHGGEGDCSHDLLKRLITHEEMKTVFFTLEKHAIDKQQILTYFISAWELASSIDFYNPIPRSRYTKWNQKIAQKATELANLIYGQDGSPDLIPPRWMQDSISLMSENLREYGNSFVLDEFETKVGGLKYRKKLPSVQQLLNTLATCAEREARYSPPQFYWQQEWGLTPPRKLGNNNRDFQQFYFVNFLKKKTVELFGQPLHQVVADIANVVFNCVDDIWTTEKVRKL